MKAINNHCEVCQRDTLHWVDKPNHLLHFLLIIFTAGWWVIAYILFLLFRQEVSYCDVCKSTKTRLSNFVYFAGVILIGFALDAFYKRLIHIFDNPDPVGLLIGLACGASAFIITPFGIRYRINNLNKPYSKDDPLNLKMSIVFGGACVIAFSYISFVNSYYFFFATSLVVGLLSIASSISLLNEHEQ
jgi:hypothetical protein